MNEMTDKTFEPSAKTVLPAPDTHVDVRETFGIDIDWQVPAFSKADERVPDLDQNYVFDADTTLAILAGLLLGTVGLDPASGISRYTFGWYELYDGVDFIAVGELTHSARVLDIGLDLHPVTSGM